MKSAVLFGGLLFSGIGLAALGYGRKRGSTRAMVIGGALMAYPYFVSNTVVLYVLGVALVIALFLFRD